MPSRATERINFGKIKEIIAPPNLIELQTNSYIEFLQTDASPTKRKLLGLQAVFKEVFPIESYDGKCVLDFHSYEIGEPKVDWLECLREGLTYGAPLYVTFLLKDEKGSKEERVFMGELPLMTPQGTFVINGAERVIVSQLHRSPGIAFEATQHPNGKMLHSFRIIPDRGSWYEAQFDTNDLLYVYLDRKKRRRKFLTTTFFRALSFLSGETKSKDADKTRGTDEEILKLFYDELEELTVKEAEKLDDLANKVLIQDATDEEKGLVVARAFEPLSKAVVKQIAELGVNKIKVVDTTVDDGIIIKCMKKDPAKNEEEALKDIYRRLRPGDPPTAARRSSSGCSLIPSVTTWAGWAATRSTRKSACSRRAIRASSRRRIWSRPRNISCVSRRAKAAWTTLIISAAAASARWANCWPTSAGSAWRARNASSRSA